jgi:serine/threonine protein kinase
MLYGRCPFRAETERELYRKIAKGSFNFPDEVYPKLPEYNDVRVSAAAKNMIRKMLNVNGDKRIKSSEIISDEWMRN